MTGYTHPRQLLKLAGLNLTEQSSGEKRGQRTIFKRGRPGLRRVLYQISMGLVCNNTEFKALYRHLKTRAQNPLAVGKAMVALMSKAARILFRLARHREMYDASKVLGGALAAQLKSAA